jgi:hypothetical protein
VFTAALKTAAFAGHPKNQATHFLPGWQLAVPTAAKTLVVRRVSEVCCGASDLAAFV